MKRKAVYVSFPTGKANKQWKRWCEGVVMVLPGVVVLSIPIVNKNGESRV